MPVPHCMFSAGRCVFWCPLAGAESDFCGRNGRWKGLIFRHNRVLVQNQGTVLKKSSHRGVHPGHFPSREGKNERRPISCAHSSWIKRSTCCVAKGPGCTLLCRFPFCFYFFARARAFRRTSRPAPFEIGSHGYEHRDLGLHSYPCARLRIGSRETVSAVPFSVPHMVLSTRGNYSLLKWTRDRSCTSYRPCALPVSRESPLDRKAQPIIPRAEYESKVTSVKVKRD